METVSKFDQKGTDIILHGCKNLTEIIYLLGLHILLLLLLGHHADKESDFVAETLPDILYRIRSILNDIMQEGRNHRICTQFQFLSHYTGHVYRMYDIRLAGLAFLGTVSLTGKFKGSADARHVLCILLLLNKMKQVICHALNHAVIVRFHRLS